MKIDSNTSSKSTSDFCFIDVGDRLTLIKSPTFMVLRIYGVKDSATVINSSKSEI